MVKPEARKQAVTHMMTAHNLSERTACQLASVSRTGYRYHSKARNDDVLRQRLKKISGKTSSLWLFVSSQASEERRIGGQQEANLPYLHGGRAPGTNQETQKASAAETADDCASRA